MEIEPRIFAVFPYYRLNANVDSNHYAFPIPVVFYWNQSKDELYDIVYAPIFGTGSKTLKDLEGPFPWESMRPNEYHHALREALGGTTRTDIKPLVVQQPEGASFTVEGRVLKWQKVIPN